MRVAKRIIVIDRAVSFGGPGGPVAGEVRAALYGQNPAPLVFNFIAGLAGRDVIPEDYMAMYDQANKMRADDTRQENYTLYGVRE